MKLISCALILLSCSYAVGQTAPAKSTPAAQGKEHAKQGPAEVAPDTPVITVPGVCDAPASTKDCKTVVTRAQFEALVTALSAGRPGGITKIMYGQLAAQYADMLVYVQEAEKRGIDKDADTQMLLRFAHMQVLTNRLLQSVQAKLKPSPEEIKKYYGDHSADYQGISVQRLMVPLGHKAEGSKPEDAKTLAEEMRKRLVAGEDAGKLEQEIYTKLGFTFQPPATTQILRPSTLPADQQSVTKLKPGEVSAAFSDQSALVIYKVEGKKTVPLDQVSEGIRDTLEKQKVQAAGDAMKSGHKPQLDLAYFSPHGDM